MSIDVVVFLSSYCKVVMNIGHQSHVSEQIGRHRRAGRPCKQHKRERMERRFIQLHPPFVTVHVWGDFPFLFQRQIVNLWKR